MALNPQLFANGTPVPFVGEMFVLSRDGVEFEVDKIPEAPGGHVKAKGNLYLSNIRMVFVAKKPVGNFVAFDMPLGYGVMGREELKKSGRPQIRTAMLCLIETHGGALSI